MHLTEGQLLFPVYYLFWNMFFQAKKLRTWLQSPLYGAIIIIILGSLFRTRATISSGQCMVLCFNSISSYCCLVGWLVCSKVTSYVSLLSGRSQVARTRGGKRLIMVPGYYYPCVWVYSWNSRYFKLYQSAKRQHCIKISFSMIDIQSK